MFVIGDDDRHRRPRPDAWTTYAVAFREYRGAVAMIAADAADQIVWMNANRWPSDELRQTLDDAVYSQQGLLRRAWLVTQDAVEAVADVINEFDSWSDESLWQSPEALISRAEWAHVRSTARRALDLIDGWRAEAGPVEQDGS